MIVFIEHDVLRLHVSMDHGFAVSSVQGGAQLLGNVESALDGELPLRLQDVMEVGAVDEGHRNELRPGNIAQIVNAENVPVRNLAGQQQLLLEALHGFRMNH